MDQFGVLVESIGFKSQGKSAPMADLKGKNSSINDGFPQNFGIKSSFDTKPTSLNRSKPSYNSNLVNGSFNDDLDGIFRSNNNWKTKNSGATNDYDDIFAGPNSNLKPSESHRGVYGGSVFDLDSVFKDSNNLGSRIDDDIFAGMPGLKSYGSGNYDDVFGSMASLPKQSDSIDDLLGNFGGMGMQSNDLRRNSGQKQENASESDDLIPGFGGSSPSSNREKSRTSPSQQSTENSAKSFSTLTEDPFVFLERTQGRTGEGSRASDIENHLDSFFSPGTQSSNAQSQRSTTEDFVFDTLFQNRGGSKVEQTSSGSSYTTKKASSLTNNADDFSFLFGMGAAPSSREFQEIEGESEERRRARLNHHLRTQERMAKVLNEKNQRDLQTQQEQEERHRIAETLDDDIKHWAAGKEGNLRALLSSLQYVLWPECGWQPVSLTDLITSVSVKKVYYKATLFVHPDKVQQKGANLQQKYIAEKVFDLLKEAWNKFNSEELK